MLLEAVEAVRFSCSVHAEDICILKVYAMGAELVYQSSLEAFTTFTFTAGNAFDAQTCLT